MSKLEDITSRESVNSDTKEEEINQMNNTFKSKEIEAENIKEINQLLETVHQEEMESKTGKRKISKSMYTKRPLTNRDSFINDTTSEEFLLLVSKGQFNPFGEKWSETIESIKQNSPFKNFSTYSVKSFIAKANDDLRQEVMTMQLIEEFDKAFKKEFTNLRLRPYEILITSSSSGLIEFLLNSISIDGLKKQLQLKGVYGLHQFFKTYFKNKFEEAQRNFVCSLAAYSLVCYFLSIKDRHNGNIMLDMNGYVVHIDYGFILGISPGNNMNFENAPFKFTKEYLDIMEGENSDIMDFFINEFYKGFIVARKYYEKFETIILSMCSNEGSSMPCFVGRKAKDVIRQFKEKFYLNKTAFECREIVRNIIQEAINNRRTAQYDYFQFLTNGILK